ncbi:MAG: hypothetical protein IKH54_03770 [Bacilli bacterium]|nr:hypothetical protein [Bacilli bacterium]
MQVKEAIKKLVGDKNLQRYFYGTKIANINKDNKIKYYFKVNNYKLYTKLFSKIKLESIKSNNFYYHIDINKTFYHKGQIIGNLMLDYNMILDKSINDYKEEISKISNEELYKNELDLINGIELLINREINIVNNKDIKDSLKGLLDRKANSFKDALQRILFINQLLWQTGIFLNGIGRLDLILDKYYIDDIVKKIISKKEAKEYLKEFLKLLHKDYYFKSNSLYGDTGQIIILGGIDKKGNYFTNDLTYMIIELMEELKDPDPKVLLRVSKNVPRSLMDLSLKCISTGIGCPLFANDDVIIPKLIDFGYSKEDAYNYGTAACWEPYIPGKSFDQNNLGTINFMEPLKDILKETNINSTEELKKNYYKYLNKYLDRFRNKIDSKVFAKDAILTLFNKDCITNNKDISNGGAIYNNYGFTSVGLSNLVNSILIVDNYVFKNKKLTMEEFIKIVNSNYEEQEKLIKQIKLEEDKYGVDKDYIIELTNTIIKEVSSYFKNKKNPLGGKYKFGLSAPSYITESIDYPASFDGRKAKEPFAVHISNDKANAYTELVSFASQLDYSDNRFNGNVIDFFITPNFIKDNYNKFLDFLLLSIKKGFFEMQMNVISSKQLIEARENPEKFPNLIVRVWGFSAYFKDLPDEYKDYLIERALKNEGNSN